MRIIVKTYSFVGGNIFLIFPWVAASPKGQRAMDGVVYIPLLPASYHVLCK